MITSGTSPGESRRTPLRLAERGHFEQKLVNNQRSGRRSVAHANREIDPCRSVSDPLVGPRSPVGLISFY